MKIRLNPFLFMIVAILLTTIAPAHANENPNSTSVKAIASIPLPQLNFNNSHTSIVIVRGELSPGQNIQSKNFDSTTIPMGAIIYHDNNLTTVFDATGKQVLIADDKLAHTVHTFKGDQPATYIHEVPDKSVVVDNGNTLTVVYNNTRILSIININNSQSNQNMTFALTAATTCDGGNLPDQYVEGTESSTIANPGRFSADWNVPTSPLNSGSWGSGHAKFVTIWNGFYGCVDGDNADTLIQPVLEWYFYDSSVMPSPPTSPQWTMSTWYLWGNGQHLPNSPYTFIHSLRNSNIYSGDEMRGNLEINILNYDAIGSIANLGPNGAGSSTLFLLEDSTPERMPAHNLTATIVLEGWHINIINNGDATNLPGPVTFKNFIFTDHDGNNLLATTPMTSFVNTQYWNPNTFVDAGNLTVYNRWPSDITLVNNPNRVNPPVANFYSLVRFSIGPTSVPFWDQSTGSPFLWSWDFGDGGTSTDQNPTHLYQTSGSFTVNQTVWNAGRISSVIKSNYIIIVFIPIPGFVINVNHGTAPLSVQFNDTSIYTPTSWNWSFGDGNYSTARNVSHTYTQTGTYNVSLYVANVAGGNTSTPRTINVSPVMKDTIGVYRNGVFYLRNSNTAGNADIFFNYGILGDIPVVGDWNLDGIDTIGVYRNGAFYLRNSNSAGNADLAFIYGQSGDVPVVGDWNLDGIDTIGVYRNSMFYLRNSNSAGPADLSFAYGAAGDVPVVGDWI